MLFTQSPYAGQIVATHTFDFGVLHICNGYVVSEVLEGVTLSYDDLMLMIEQVNHYFGDLPCAGYISNRVYPYATNPADALEAGKHIETNLKIAIVKPAGVSQGTLDFERRFCVHEIKDFKELGNAIQWIAQLQASHFATAEKNLN